MGGLSGGPPQRCGLWVGVPFVLLHVFIYCCLAGSHRNSTQEFSIAEIFQRRVPFFFLFSFHSWLVTETQELTAETSWEGLNLTFFTDLFFYFLSFFLAGSSQTQHAFNAETCRVLVGRLELRRVLPLLLVYEALSSLRMRP